MGDWGVIEASTRRRRATLAAGRSTSLLPVNDKSGAVCQSSLTANSSATGRENRSLETAYFKSKRSEKKKRRDGISDRLG